MCGDLKLFRIICANVRLNFAIPSLIWSLNVSTIMDNISQTDLALPKEDVEIKIIIKRCNQNSSQDITRPDLSDSYFWKV